MLSASNAHSNLHPFCRKQRGIGLIEILVAVLVLSIGILGVAGLQTRALTSSVSSTGHSLATIATYSIIDAMLVDRVNAVATNYNITVVADNCPAGGSLTQNQIKNWCETLKDDLGDAATTKGTVECTPDGSGRASCTITVEYDNSNIGTADTGNSNGSGNIQTVVTKTDI